MNPRKSDLQRDGLRRVIANAIALKSAAILTSMPRSVGALAVRLSCSEQRAGVSGPVSGDASPFASESQAFFESVSADSLWHRCHCARFRFMRDLSACRPPRPDSWIGEVTRQADQPHVTRATA